MRLDSTQSAWVRLGMLGVVFLGSLGWLIGAQIPNLTTQRDSLDSDRFSLALIQELQENQVQLQAQADEVETETKYLTSEIWTFTKEPEFYETWDRLAGANGTHIEIKNLADVVPGPQPILRAMEVEIIGHPTVVLGTIDAIAKQRPLAAIQSVVMQAGETPSQVVALVNLETVWR